MPTSRLESRLGRSLRATFRWSACLIVVAACGDSGSSDDAGIRGDGSVSDAGTLPAKPCEPQPAATPSPARCSANPEDTSLPPCEQWAKVEPAGAVCSDGSQYKFFINFTTRSDNLVVMFEPGGACWDYESCSGGQRGAANPHGIPDDHMSNAQYLNLLRRTDDNPARDYNFVFVSYCTGDVHAGDKVATYADPAGGPALTYRHVGLANSQKVVDYLAERFPTVPQLLVTGCSAGGIGALQNYAFFRNGLTGTQCGYLLDDSGPSFHSDGNSKQLQAIVRTAWNLDTLFARLSAAVDVPEPDFGTDFGRLNTALADHFPSDRIALTAYRMDFNYSLYSYERFFPGSTPADIHDYFWQDLQALLETYDTRANLGYYVPYFRHDNCSHCVSIPPIDHDTDIILTMPWLGSEISAAGATLRTYVEQLLDDRQPLPRIVEMVRPDTDFTSEELRMCLTPDPSD
ncbi:MAG TPA: pectin acetylesterase-family hydrolase [Polyangiales bacterium]|nr:pectin acetylesterase-family hydrolase [Polyangiales bacterium]